MTTPFQVTQSFVPTQIPGCQLWFDAADQTTFTYSSGSNLSQWRDKSSNAYSVIQPTASNQPALAQRAQNSLSGIQFSQSTYLYQTATSMPNFTTGGSTSVLMAARNANNNDSWNIINTIWFDTGAGSATLRYHFSFNQNATDGTTLYTNGALVGQVTSNAVAPSANALIGFTASATSQTIHTNGSTNSYPGTTLPDATGITDFIFNDARNNLASANTMIFEMVGYNTQITTAQRQLLEGYLAWKWGLVANLPADHPYKTTSILSLPPFPNAPRQRFVTQVNLFQPTQVSGCTVWLDGADPNGNGSLPANGSAVSSWVDKSSNGMTVSAASSQPTYSTGLQNGLGVLTFDGTKNLTTGNVLASKFAGNTVNFTLFCLFSLSNTVTGSTYASPFCFANGTGVPRIALSIGNNADGVMMDVGSNVIGRTTFSVPPPTFDNTFCFISYFKNGSNTQLNLNGSNKATTTNQDVTQFGSSSFPFNVGNGYTTPAYFMRGNVGEILFFNSTLSTPNFQLIEGYLAWKWGLQASLPSTHPYRNTPVYSVQPFPLVPRVAAATSRYFNPASIPGCSLWLDAADQATVTLSGVNATQWNDKSGTGNTASTVGTIPYTGTIGNLKAMNYPGTVSTYFTGTLVNTGTTLSAFSVFLMNSSSYSSARILSLAKPGSFDFNSVLHTTPISRFSSDFSAYRNLTQLGKSTAIFGVPVFASSVFTGASNTFYLNGTTGSTVSSSGNFGYSNYEIGGSFGEENLVPLNGFIGEVLHFTTALSTFARQQVEGYLAWKWGLQGNLPPNHPYKLFPPSP
jgi:hypothetical protein